MNIRLKSRYIPGHLNLKMDRLSQCSQVISSEWSPHPQMAEAIWQNLIERRLQEKFSAFQEQIQALISQAVSPASGSASGGSNRQTDTDSQSSASSSYVRSSKRKHKKKKKKKRRGLPPLGQSLLLKLRLALAGVLLCPSALPWRLKLRQRVDPAVRGIRAT